MGGPFAKTIHRQAGPWTLLILSLGLFSPLLIGLFPLGSFLLSLFLMMLIQSEAEKRGMSFIQSALLGIGGAILIWAGSTQVWLSLTMSHWSLMFDNIGEAFLQQLKTLPSMSEVKIEKSELIEQFPGAIASIYILFFGFGIGLERKIHHLFKYPYERYAAQLRPLEFKVPDPFIWIVLLSALLTMVNGAPLLQVIGKNLVAVGFAVYFFQGLAILEVFLIFLRAHPFLKFFTYFALVGQLLLVISAIGFVDFWLDLRKKMRNSLQKTQS